mmetsp:Transcript_21526/g.58848  ORF Transcript_21526/g.58848 Transcript_21526/m.58848 type:complete len:213 (+) Transcript_21526:1222-1860(+)
MSSCTFSPRLLRMSRKSLISPMMMPCTSSLLSSQCRWNISCRTGLMAACCEGKIPVTMDIGLMPVPLQKKGFLMVRPISLPRHQCPDHSCAADWRWASATSSQLIKDVVPSPGKFDIFECMLPLTLDVLETSASSSSSAMYPAGTPLTPTCAVRIAPEEPLRRLRDDPMHARQSFSRFLSRWFRHVMKAQSNETAAIAFSSDFTSCSTSSCF